MDEIFDHTVKLRTVDASETEINIGLNINWNMIKLGEIM